MADKIFPKGLRIFKKNDKTPESVICSMVVTPDELNAFCIDNPNLMTEYKGQQQLKVQVLRSKDGNLYCAVDTWKPTSEPSQPSPLPGKAPELPDTNDLPF